MEVFLYNSTVCRLCGEENDNGSFLYLAEENNQNISELVNAYLPIKVSDDGQLPRTICPGCTIQLEATVEFINLIVNGQKVIRALYQRELEYKKTVLQEAEIAPESSTCNVVEEVNVENGAYQPDHSISLQVAGLDKPKRKRGRPPKKHKTPEELAQEAVAKERELQSAKRQQKEEDLSGKRKRKTPTRFREVVQGKELEKIFKDEGMTDGEESEPEVKPEAEEPVAKEPTLKIPEVIGHTDTGELVVVVKGKGRGRPKGRLLPKRQICAICDKEFFCSGRYMSHVAQHGPVMYQCRECCATFGTRLDFTKHQDETGHRGQTVIPCEKKHDPSEKDPLQPDPEPEPASAPAASGPEANSDEAPAVSPQDSIPEPPPIAEPAPDNEVYLQMPEIDAENETIEEKTKEPVEDKPTGKLENRKKIKLTCPYCDKLFSSKQSRSMHIKAVHKGERPYTCGECGVTFAYPRALALHALRHRTNTSKGYACDLCGKVLNHPSSVTYHKEAEHAGHKYVCNKCHKTFKHKQLLQRHQLVHTHHRPFQCKICNATFKTKANLFNHTLLHSGVKRFACEVCKQTFAHKTSLTLHMRWHNGYKPYACKVCGKAFSQKGNLSEHSRIHTGEKPFQCAQCPRRFTTSSQHRLHMRRHANNKDKPFMVTVKSEPIPQSEPVAAGTGSGPVPVPAPHSGGPGAYRCGWCGRVCTTRWALAKHARRHTGERPFKCPHCPRAFADCSNLNKHKKQVHKQTSLLANQQPDVGALHIIQEGQEEGTEFAVVETSHDGVEERVIYVTYDVDDAHSPEDYQLVNEEQAEELVVETEVPCEMLRDASSLLLHHKLQDGPTQEHMSVTDEQGNPLHFTMQDGTQLAITSLDGQSLQVITQDGQTIPVEINGLSPEEVQTLSEPDTVELQLDDQKTIEQSLNSSVTHYFYEAYEL